MEPESEIKLAAKRRKKIRQRCRRRRCHHATAAGRRARSRRRAIFELIMSDRFTLTFNWPAGRLAAPRARRELPTPMSAAPSFMRRRCGDGADFFIIVAAVGVQSARALKSRVMTTHSLEMSDSSLPSSPLLASICLQPQVGFTALGIVDDDGVVLPPLLATFLQLLLARPLKIGRSPFVGRRSRRGHAASRVGSGLAASRASHLWRRKPPL